LISSGVLLLLNANKNAELSASILSEISNLKSGFLVKIFLNDKSVLIKLSAILKIG
jgi:hypothetical protein